MTPNMIPIGGDRLVNLDRVYSVEYIPGKLAQPATLHFVGDGAKCAAYGDMADRLWRYLSSRFGRALEGARPIPPVEELNRIALEAVEP